MLALPKNTLAPASAPLWNKPVEKKQNKKRKQKLDAQGAKGFAKPSARDPAEISVRAPTSWSRRGPEIVDSKTLM